jgi:hypothetical protein
MIPPLVILLIALCCAVGYGLASNHATAVAVGIATVAAVIALQISYFIGIVLHG